MTQYDDNVENPPLEGDATRKMEVPLGGSAKELLAVPSLTGLATGFYELFPGMPTPTLFREMISEFFGVFLIVQMGTGTVCSAIFSGDIYGGAQTGVWQIAVVWGIAVVIAVGMAGPVSGAHLNPAMTIALALFRKFPKSKILWYIEAQLLGAMAAAFVNLRLFAGVIRKYESKHGFQRGSEQSYLSARAFGEYPTIGIGRAFFAEALGTAILAFVIFALTNPKNETTRKYSAILVPTTIGATVACLLSVLGPLTQCGLNPARDFGPRIVASIAGWGPVAMKLWWLYICAPIVGAIVGALLSDVVLYI